MTSELDYPWIAGIRAFEDEVPSDATFLPAWRTALEHWGIVLHDNGNLVRGTSELGTWRLLPVNEANDLLTGCDINCPLVGPRLGALAFNVPSWLCGENDRHELFCGLLKEGRDGFAHRPSRRSWNAVVKRSYSLDRCIGKFSFDDGAQLLTRNEGPYASCVCDAFSAPLLRSDTPSTFHG